MNFTVLNAPLKYSSLTAGHTYAIVLGQSNVMIINNGGFEWCTANVDTNLNFGKYNGTTWVSEPSLGDGWLKVYVDKTVRTNEYAFPAGAQVVFFDDFQRTTGLIGNGWYDYYNVLRNDTTYVEIYNESGGNKSVRIKKNSVFENGDTNWTNYTLSAKIKVTTLNTVISLRFRDNHQELYELDLFDGTQLSLSKYVSGWSDLASDSVSYTVNTYYNLKIAVSGSNFKVYFDNSPSALIDYTDASPVTNGRIAIFASLGSTIPSQAQPGIFNDVLVTVP
jgi:hypothetical protein